MHENFISNFNNPSSQSIKSAAIFIFFFLFFPAIIDLGYSNSEFRCRPYEYRFDYGFHTLESLEPVLDFYDHVGLLDLTSS